MHNHIGLQKLSVKKEPMNLKEGKESILESLNGEKGRAK